MSVSTLIQNFEDSPSPSPRIHRGDACAAVQVDPDRRVERLRAHLAVAYLHIDHVDEQRRVDPAVSNDRGES